MKNSLERLLGIHRAWLSENGERIYEREAKYLKIYISDGSLQAFQRMLPSLDAMATYFGVRGIIKVIEGHESGWNEIAMSLDFHGWSLKIQAESFFGHLGIPSANMTGHVSRAACLVCVSDKWGPIAEEILERINNTTTSVNERYWKKRRFEPFVIQCCNFQNRASIERSAQIALPYGGIFLAWDDTAALADALETVCEYHSRNIEDRGGSWEPEFKYSPFDFLPCEIILVKRIREMLELPMPVVKHRLVSLLGFEKNKIDGCSEHAFVLEVKKSFEGLGISQAFSSISPANHTPPP